MKKFGKKLNCVESALQGNVAVSMDATISGEIRSSIQKQRFQPFSYLQFMLFQNTSKQIEEQDGQRKPHSDTNAS
ncbi:MAG TPA: hypothetical protein PLF23_20680 [Candidatus Obscuribacter sp.]|nr:hypothetical protein [Candidatus Obscuribacter sp.]